MIQLETCSFSYGSHTVFENVSLTIEPGFYFIVGQNGRGKTTLLHLLAGWTKTDGLITDIENTAYLPTSYQINPHLQIRDVVEIYELSWDEFIKSSIYQKMLLADLSSTSRIGELSSGELQRLLITIILNQTKDSLVLDEPFNHLDWWAQKQLVNYLQKSKYKYIFVTTHDFQTPLQFDTAKLLLLADKSIHDLGPCKEALISKKFQKSFHFQTQIIDNPIDRSSILAVAENNE